MIKVYHCGFDSYHAKPLDAIQPRSIDYTLLIVKTDAYFNINGNYIYTQPETIALFEKNCYIHYGRREPHYNDDWIHFDIDDEDQEFLASLDLHMNSPIQLQSLKQIPEYTRLIVMEMNDDKPNKDIIVDSLMRALLLSLSSIIHAKPDDRFSHIHYRTMLALRESIKNAPHNPLTVESMAKQVHMSKSHFQHLYKELFGVSCMQEVISERMKKARHYLRSTEMSIMHLSELCGYKSESHFMRQFKKIEGITPSQYRRRYSEFT